MKWNFTYLFNAKLLKSMIPWFVIFEFGFRTSAHEFFCCFESGTSEEVRSFSLPKGLFQRVTKHHLPGRYCLAYISERWSQKSTLLTIWYWPHIIAIRVILQPSMISADDFLQTCNVTWGDASDQNWKYRFKQRDLSAVSNGVISCHIKRWSAVSSLPRRHLEYVAVRSVSNLFAASKNILSCNLMRLKIGLQLRQIWKVSRS